MKSILNVSAYLFVSLEDPAHWCGLVRSQAQAHQLKGTVLLATEGINLFVAGEPDHLRAWIRWLQTQTPFIDLRSKESWSSTVPFKKLVVKVKSEIIRMNCEAIHPQNNRAPSVNAATLARWLDNGHDDAGREVLLLDTRNAFEIEQGRFQGAMDWHLQKFSDFPAALQAHAKSLTGKTVVSYCTGGIRCEKAALLMQTNGIDTVLQLEGGILQYFAEMGPRHFIGECFVFDERVAVDAALAPTTQASSDF